MHKGGCESAAEMPHAAHGDSWEAGIMQMFTCAAVCIAAAPQDPSSQVCGHLLPVIANSWRRTGKKQTTQLATVFTFLQTLKILSRLQIHTPSATKKQTLKRLNVWGFFFILKNYYIRIHLEQRDVVLVFRIKIKTILNEIVMPRHVGRRHGLAFAVLPVRFLSSPAPPTFAGDNKGRSKCATAFLTVGNVIEYFILRR